MKLDTLLSLSPLDGRYVAKVEELRPLFSEYALLQHRVLVEIEWLKLLSQQKQINNFVKLSRQNEKFLDQIYYDFNITDAQEIQEIEKTTNHDVKAVEYFIQKKLTQHNKLKKLIPLIHFACTSEDINNVSYGLMLKSTREKIFIPIMENIYRKMMIIVKKYKNVAMLSRTHGQSASPTTVGKEFLVFAKRLQREMTTFAKQTITAKFNGAVGNFNAHAIALPKMHWLKISRNFITSLGLTWNPYTTQIEPHDAMIELLQALGRFNSILIDLCRDVWGYISLDYLRQKRIAAEVGSSTMPHKINPIDFENAEGNFGLANALVEHFAMKLPISRWQRDLSDSTVLRNLASIFGYSLIAMKSLLKGLNKLEVNFEKINEDLDCHWEVLAEALQTILRLNGEADAYEKLKALTRGEGLTREKMKNFITQLSLPTSVKQRLLTLTPKAYVGLAKELCELGE